MSFFRYEAVDRTGKIVMGTMDAPNEAMVSARLTQMGYRPQRVIPTPGTSARSNGAGAVTGRQPSATSVPQPSTASPPSYRGGATPKELALFFRQFAALVRSGITLFQALDHLAPRTPHAGLSQTAREMSDAARTGGRISDVMAQYPRLYASHVVAALRSGEQGGFLEIVLDEIALDYEQEIAFYKGTWITKWLIGQGLLALAIGQPLFPHLFPNAQYGLYLRLVFLRNIPILAALGGLLLLWYNRMQLPENREKRDRLALKVPVFGDLARQKSLASFCRTLYHLFQAGIGPISAWEGAMNVAPNAVIRSKLVEAHEMVRGGVPIHDAFTATGLFANETEQLLATGIVSGQVVDMLDRVAVYYQDNVDRAFSNARYWMFSLAVSLTIALSGALLIILVKNYFAGIFEFADKFEQGG